MASCGEPHPRKGLSEIVRFPYLQQLGSDSTLVLWTAISREPYTVEVETPGGDRAGSFDSSIENEAPDGAAIHAFDRWLDEPADKEAHQHVVRLSSLEPDHIYCYSITRDGEIMAGPIGFRTAPASHASTPISFVAFGDSGYGGADQQAVTEQMQRVPFDLALATGDMAYGSGTLSQLERLFFDMYEPMFGSVPIFLTPGNHDYATANGAPFREVFALPENGAPDGLERWYSFDWGNVHFVAIDRQYIGPVQARWLEDDLERNELPWTIAITHQSPYSSGAHGGHAGFRELISPILERYGVQLVLAGHDHDYERTKVINGVTYVVTGAAGRGTRPVGESDFTAFSLDVLHFVYVRIDGADLRLYAIDATGQEMDFAHIVNRELTANSEQ